MEILIVGAVIRNKKDKNKILLVQQAKGHTHEGMWGVPGGKVKEKESLEEALKREVREETNLDISVVRPLHVIKLEKENVVIYYYECEYQEEKIKPGSDVAKAAWVSLEEMEKYKLRLGMHELKELLKQDQD